MKRSWMLDYIEGELGCAKDFYTHRELAEIILSTIEAKGMQPPPVRDILVNPSQVDPYWKSNSWEPECEHDWKYIDQSYKLPDIQVCKKCGHEA